MNNNTNYNHNVSNNHQNNHHLNIDIPYNKNVNSNPSSEQFEFDDLNLPDESRIENNYNPNLNKHDSSIFSD